MAWHVQVNAKYTVPAVAGTQAAEALSHVQRLHLRPWREASANRGNTPGQFDYRNTRPSAASVVRSTIEFFANAKSGVMTAVP